MDSALIAELDEAAKSSAGTYFGELAAKAAEALRAAEERAFRDYRDGYRMAATGKADLPQPCDARDDKPCERDECWLHEKCMANATPSGAQLSDEECAVIAARELQIAHWKFRHPTDTVEVTLSEILRAIRAGAEAGASAERKAEWMFGRVYLLGYAAGASAAGGPWKDAIIDALVVSHIYQKKHEDDPRQALRDLLCWKIDVALDPRVSERAKALQDAAPRADVPREPVAWEDVHCPGDFYRRKPDGLTCRPLVYGDATPRADVPCSKWPKGCTCESPRYCRDAAHSDDLAIVLNVHAAMKDSDRG